MGRLKLFPFLLFPIIQHVACHQRGRGICLNQKGIPARKEREVNFVPEPIVSGSALRLKTSFTGTLTQFSGWFFYSRCVKPKPARLNGDDKYVGNFRIKPARARKALVFYSAEKEQQ